MKQILKFCVIAFALSTLLTGNTVLAQLESPCDDCITYCTYTQGGWMQTCSGGNVGCVRDLCFASVFPGGVTIGGYGGFTATWTTSVSVDLNWPNSGPSSPLDANIVNQSNTGAGTLAGQLLAATFNREYGAASCDGMVSTGGLVITSGDFQGWTVDELLAFANEYIGGNTGLLGDSLEASDITTALTAYNENFDNCYDNDGYLDFPAQGATVVIRDVNEPLPLSFCLNFTPQCNDICVIWWCAGCDPTHDFATFTSTPGCLPPYCEYEDCEPSTGVLTGFESSAQQIFADIPGDGCWWYSTVHATAPGCFCVSFDFQLPVELFGFAALAGNGQVRLEWATATETDNHSFEILRDGVKVAEIESRGSASTGADYAWIDNDVVNGTTYSYSLVAVDMNGGRSTLRIAEATPAESAGIPREYSLNQNFPNPFNPSTTISFDVPNAGHVKLAVYDLNGREVATLVNRNLDANSYTVSFDASALTSGTYFYRIEAASFTAVRKMLFLK